MNKLKSILALLTMLSIGFSTAHANDNCEKTCPFELGATFLYLKPNIDDTHFVLSSINNTFGGSLYPVGKRHQNNTQISPGFRVEGIYALCPNVSNVDMRFSYLYGHSTTTVSGAFLYDTNGYPGFGAQDSPVYAGTARSKDTYNYYAGDLTYDRKLACFCPENLTFMVGLHCAYIKFQEHTLSTGTFSTTAGPQPYNNNMNRRSQFFGIGPELGLRYQYFMSSFCWLRGEWALNAETRASLLSGCTKSDLNYVTLRTGPVGISVTNSANWRVVPTSSTDLSISYGFNCACYATTIELGYDFTWYGTCVNKIIGTDVAFAGDTFDMFNSYTMQGPFVSASVAF